MTKGTIRRLMRDRFRESPYEGGILEVSGSLDKEFKGWAYPQDGFIWWALSTYNLIPLFAQRCERIIGTDVSLEVAMVAKRGMVTEWNDWTTFISKKDIIVSLKGLQRRLKPEGALIVTLDNPSN